MNNVPAGSQPVQSGLRGLFSGANPFKGLRMRLGYPDFDGYQYHSRGGGLDAIGPPLRDSSFGGPGLSQRSATGLCFNGPE